MRRIAQSNLTLPLIVTLGAAIALTYCVVEHGWISDDAFISFRYARNLLDGNGPVYNAGEHVQGYTHPLWFFLITAGLEIFDNPLYVAVIFGALLTALSLLVTGYGLTLRTDNPAVASVGVLWIALLFVSSEAWLSFQTSGLESSLAHLLIASIVLEAFRARPRPFVLSLLGALLVLTRPDLVALVAPIGLVALYYNHDRRSLKLLALGLVPLIAWLIFAAIYYGDIVPNTAQAKVGIFGSLDGSIDQGWKYLKDWSDHEPLPAFGAFTLLTAGVCLSRRPYELALAAGALLYLAYVVLIGGDFMRGRFMLPFFVLSTLFGVYVLAGAIRFAPSIRAAFAAAAVMVVATLVFEVTAPPFDNVINDKGIVNERVFYAGFHLSAYEKDKRFEYGFIDLDLTDKLKQYREVCGPVTIHTPVLGALGYFAGPDVTVIDTVGLTDHYIAHLPKWMLLATPSRPGHPHKYIPIRYLAGRGDISIFGDWIAAVDNLDCSIRDQTKSYATSTGILNPFMPLTR